MRIDEDRPRDEAWISKGGSSCEKEDIDSFGDHNCSDRDLLLLSVPDGVNRRADRCIRKEMLPPAEVRRREHFFWHKAQILPGGT